MSDAGLLAIPPGPGGLEQWVFQHAQDHIRLAERVNLLLPAAKLEFQILDPLSADLDDWLLDHQHAHDDLCEITHVIGSDLETVDFRNPVQLEAWLQINQAEHAAFSVALGI